MLSIRRGGSIFFFFTQNPKLKSKKSNANTPFQSKTSVAYLSFRIPSNHFFAPS